MKPVILPMLHLLCRLQNADGLLGNVGLLGAAHAEHTLELVREDFDKAIDQIVPVVENHLGAWAAGQLQMAADEVPDGLYILRLEQRLQIDRLQIAALFGEVAALIKDVGDAAAHASGEIATTGPEDHDQTVRHVFAAVIADALDHSGCTGVADGKALAGDSVKETFTTGRTVQSHIAEDDVFLGRKAGIARRIQDETAAGEALAYVVVRVAFEGDGDSLREKRPQTLPGRTVQVDSQRTVRQSA